MAEYYYIENNARLGPFLLSELKSRRILPSTMIWTKELKEWTLAQDIEELNKIICEEPPPFPISDSQATDLKIFYQSDLSYPNNISYTKYGVYILFVTIFTNIVLSSKKTTIRNHKVWFILCFCSLLFL